MISGSLTQQRCRGCTKETPLVTPKQGKRFLLQLPGWTLVGGRLEKRFILKDFMAVIHFVNAIAKTAEAEDHHPDLHLTSYRRLRICLSTHAAGGLTKNDFILAAKIESLPKVLRAATRA